MDAHFRRRTDCATLGIPSVRLVPASRRANDSGLLHTSLHRLFSSRTAAARLGVSRSTVLRAVARAWLLPAVTTPGGHHRFRLHDVERLAGNLPGQSGSRDLVGSSEAARILDVSRHTVNRAARDGRLRSVFFHDYGGTLLVIGFLFAFWMFVQRWIMVDIPSGEFEVVV